MQQLDYQNAHKKDTRFKISSNIEMSNHDKTIFNDMVFTLPYSFKAKPGQLPYLDNDCQDNIEKKIEIIEIN
jgi:hypothetical protein